MSAPDINPFNLQVELDYDFSTTLPIAVNSTLVGSIAGEFIVDCLFIDPFSISQKNISPKNKGFETARKNNDLVKIKAIPMARLVISPASAIMLMKQIQDTLDQLNIPYAITSKNEVTEENV
jgi:hypothetical protein